MNTVALSFFLYTFLILLVGIYSARYNRATSSDYFLANRGLGSVVAGLSSAASSESGWVTLGLVGTAFTTGVGALWIIPGTVLAFLFNWLVIGERLRHFSLHNQALTIPDVLAARYQGTSALLIRLLSVLIIGTMLTAYVAAQLNAAGKTFTATFGWAYATGVLSGAAIVMVYTISGGFRAVAWTDVIQALMMVTALLILPLVLIVHLGGFEGLWQRLNELEQANTLTHPVAERSGMALVGFFAVWFGIPLGYPGQPHILVRFMAIRDRSAVRRGTLIASLWVFLLFTGAILLGIAAHAVYGSLPDPEQALPIAAADFLPGAVAGLVIAAVLAAICSTADSQLLLSASAVSHDLYVRLLRKSPDERIRVRINRLAVLLVGVVATLIAMGEVRVVFDFVLYAWAGLGAAFGPAMILKLTWKRTTAWGVLAGMLTGFVTAILWRETLHDVLYELVPAFIFAFAAVVLVSLLTNKGTVGT
ncbi:MAG: sodium/proline symporter [Pseudomonadales bacterium]|jgi:sodium/proline symporter